MATSKDTYRQLCLTEPSIPLFSQDWWLDTVCGERHWDVLLAEDNGRIRGAMPFFLRDTHTITMPPYTQTMGPWFAPASDDTKYTSMLADRQAICKFFVGHLTNYASFLQNFHHSITDWLPFYWGGYTQTTRYTYLLPDISQPDRLWEQMSPHIRRNITKAKEKYAIEVRRGGVSPEEFMRICTMTYDRQDKTMPHPDTLRRLITVCRDRNQGDIWSGYDQENRLHAVVFIAWQGNSAYYLAGGGHPILRESNAHSLVLWNAIREVSAYTSHFDFEGSMLPGVERFFREFGAVQTPFFTISRGKMSLVHRVWLKIRGK